ncbi:MAG: hypothetical protein H7Z75_19385 [Ferruginibacter sp.]|nr:hypothetical protein [Cytophagales bacterium]
MATKSASAFRFNPICGLNGRVRTGRFDQFNAVTGLHGSRPDHPETDVQPTNLGEVTSHTEIIKPNI